MKKHFKEVLQHDVVVILIATAIGITGHNFMYIRSTALMLCALWLSVTSGVWISRQTWRTGWKVWFFVLASWLFFCSAMGVMYYFMLSTLEDQQEDTFTKLSAEVKDAPTHNVMHAFFTVTNHGKESITATTSCMPNMIVGGGHRLMGPGPMLTPLPNIGTIEGNGDSQTTSCLMAVEFLGVQMQCVDVEIQTDYSLESQPKIQKSKRFRFVGYAEGSNFNWIRQRLDAVPTKYCGGFLRPPVSP